ncbi:MULTISPECIES: MarR family transcriptional regulator [unclassified Streptomyces]
MTQPVYQRQGVIRVDFAVLDLLLRSEPPHVMAPSQLAEELAVSTGALTSRLDRLEDARLVRRLSVPGDRRRLQIRLTDEGRRRALLVTNELDRSVGRVLRSMTGTQLESLTALLDALESSTLATD